MRHRMHTDTQTHTQQTCKSSSRTILPFSRNACTYRRIYIWHYLKVSVNCSLLVVRLLLKPRSFAIYLSICRFAEVYSIGRFLRMYKNYHLQQIAIPAVQLDTRHILPSAPELEHPRWRFDVCMHAHMNSWSCCRMFQHRQWRLCTPTHTHTHTHKHIDRLW